MSKAKNKREFYSQLRLAFRMPWHVTSGYFQVSVACRQNHNKSQTPHLLEEGYAIFCQKLVHLLLVCKTAPYWEAKETEERDSHFRLAGGRSK